eukprot:maker-scaffold56_size446035-snap-gene-3.27 protein:Tk11498 transcript:maker-scaffold56_size446035-snap-gene-3.27-mRNA-1 annotation:"calcium release-activated calcium channel protein 1-like"
MTLFEPNPMTDRVLSLPASSVRSSKYAASHYRDHHPANSNFYPTAQSHPQSVYPPNNTSYHSIGQSHSTHHPLHSQQSFLLPTKTLILGDSNGNMQQGVDENIYHWKVLNLSRAKLKASSRTSALLSGFAMVAMVEIQIDEKVPEPLLILFVVCTVLLIAVHMLALMISTCILPNVEAVANLHYQTQKTVFESPHMKMNLIVELAWAFSTVIGILLFLVEIAILCWVKFYPINHAAAWVATGLLIPIVMIFMAFAAHFYLKLVAHKSEVYEDGIKELQLLQAQLEDDTDGSPNHRRSPGSRPSGSNVHVV